MDDKNRKLCRRCKTPFTGGGLYDNGIEDWFCSNKCQDDWKVESGGSGRVDKKNSKKEAKS
jgi:hypothetical protein